MSESQLEEVAAYIESQESHHRTRTFKEDFVALLKKHKVEHDPARIWD